MGGGRLRGLPPIKALINKVEVFGSTSLPETEYVVGLVHVWQGREGIEVEGGLIDYWNVSGDFG